MAACRSSFNFMNPLQLSVNGLEAIKLQAHTVQMCVCEIEAADKGTRHQTLSAWYINWFSLLNCFQVQTKRKILYTVLSLSSRKIWADCFLKQRNSKCTINDPTIKVISSDGPKKVLRFQQSICQIYCVYSLLANLNKTRKQSTIITDFIIMKHFIIAANHQQTIDLRRLFWLFNFIFNWIWSNSR